MKSSRYERSIKGPVVSASPPRRSVLSATAARLFIALRYTRRDVRVPRNKQQSEFSSSPQCVSRFLKKIACASGSSSIVCRCVRVCVCVCVCVSSRTRARARAPASTLNKEAPWLILPVVICLSQRLSHACLSASRIKAIPRMAQYISFGSLDLTQLLG